MNDILDKIKAYDEIVIHRHKNPDPDALGSQLGLRDILRTNFPDKKIRDSHNCIKLLMDSLEGILFPNDYYVKPRIQAVELSRDNPQLDLVFYPDTERWE